MELYTAAMPLKVMVIEDEQRMRDLLVEVLPGMGYEPVPARTAEHALRLMEQSPVDIVMLDLNLPVMDGMTFLDKLREKRRDLPVIILTGYGSLEDARRAIRHEVVDFLTKPAHLGDVEQALDRARRKLAPAPAGSGGSGATPAVTQADAATNLAEVERRTILEALKRHGGNRTATAQELGISRRTLYNKLTEYEQQGLM
jgi:DNA-binding NtrC family response regulator